jgi:hypothetical protein
VWAEKRQSRETGTATPRCEKLEKNSHDRPRYDDRGQPWLIRGRRYVRLKRTNLRVIGLSLNRSQKRSALLSTTPRLRTRSSTNDLAPLRRMWLLSLRHTGTFVSARQEPSCCGLATAGAEIGRPAHIVASRRKKC